MLPVLGKAGLETLTEKERDEGVVSRRDTRLSVDVDLFGDAPWFKLQPLSIWRRTHPRFATDVRTRECIRIAIPSKGDIHKETLELLKSCGLEVDLRNPRQYMGGIKHFPDVELWFQRPADIVRKVKDGTLDIGVAGYDLVAEYNVSW
ncbi:ATP phosphoribosyltransferase (ATP-PRTase) (ATP-PRT) [Cyanidiococcus yangmingshanensis]|uniref:ATP phosphoribosyltransferase (ATP-PRTase) (ATP-PRT) n=1 Tax=Cyanidiococcus yangmingshanensis TaxID=2690220 RepID=A0A7J7IH76_9RHOD|nr:ATP phosphoribosyltransferase (ATP-PRTase) (ATP-PRT) [Cyanidiococcus yangmingshanensis]